MTQDRFYISLLALLAITGPLADLGQPDELPERDVHAEDDHEGEKEIQDGPRERVGADLAHHGWNHRKVEHNRVYQGERPRPKLGQFEVLLVFNTAVVAEEAARQRVVVDELVLVGVQVHQELGRALRVLRDGGDVEPADDALADGLAAKQDAGHGGRTSFPRIDLHCHIINVSDLGSVDILQDMDETLGSGS